MGHTIPAARRSLTAIALLALSVLGLLTSRGLAATPHDTPAPFHLDRNSPLDRTAVAFLKGLMQVREDGLERLLVVAQDGRVLAASDGTKSEVGVPAFDRSAVPEGEGVLLVHSHPSSTSFSRADLLHLSRGGVEAVVALGADGSVYFATRGPRFMVNSVGAAYDSALKGAEEIWRSAGSWYGGPNVKPAAHVPHIVSQALASAGVIVYRATMPFDRERSYFDGAVLFALMVECAAEDVRGALAR